MTYKEIAANTIPVATRRYLSLLIDRDEMVHGAMCRESTKKEDAGDEVELHQCECINQYKHKNQE